MGNQTIVTGKVRFSYANLFEPRAAQDGQEPKYSLSVIIPKSDTKTIADIQAAVEAAKEAGKGKWGGKIPKNLKLPLRDGDIDREDDPNYANCYFFNCSSKRAPGVVNKYNQRILDSSEVYSGCYGRVQVNFYPFASSGNNGVAVGLQNVQKVEDGEPLGGVAEAPEVAFAAYAESDGAGFLD